MQKLNRQKLGKLLISRIGQFAEHSFRLDIFSHLRKFILAKNTIKDIGES